VHSLIQMMHSIIAFFETDKADEVVVEDIAYVIYYITDTPINFYYFYIICIYGGYKDKIIKNI